ncbi:MAG UNVERIFIED_CONTAM: S1C family serine protease [Planctomycetaceae bacterium]|jgi:S1-C subfamily serine protease
MWSAGGRREFGGVTGGKLGLLWRCTRHPVSLDLAILRVADLELPALSLSADEKTPQGREVVALGHPEGFRNSIVSGVISGHQDIEGVEMLQLAMSIERGNSGGPVLDRQGAVVGIVTRKSALQDKLGFAVPVLFAARAEGGSESSPDALAGAR